MARTINLADLAPKAPEVSMANDNKAAPAGDADNEKGDGSDGTAQPSGEAAVTPVPEKETKSPDAPPNIQTADAIRDTELHEGDKGVFYNATERTLRDPHTGDMFYPGVHTKVKELGIWTIIQVKAGFIKVGDANRVGEKEVVDADFSDAEARGKTSKK